MSSYDRRNFIRLASAVAGGGALASGCSGSSLGGGATTAHDGPVKIGLIYPKSGPYKVVSDDQINGFNLYLKLNGNKLGGRDVEVIPADESNNAGATKLSVERLLDKEKCLAVCGIIASDNLVAVKDMFTEAKVPLLCTNAGTNEVERQEYVWRTSFVNHQVGASLGAYAADKVDGTLATISPDYLGGREMVDGFLRTFKSNGGKTAGKTVITRFPIGGLSYQPDLQKIEQLQPDAVYCFFGGGEAVKFVKEYKKFGLADKYQLYAAGFVTEGTLLAAQGDAALGVLTSLYYAPDLDNPANRKFVAEYQKTHKHPPTCFSVTSYDAAWILDKAIAAAGEDLNSQTIEDKIGDIGKIDSPRGSWQFGKGRAPIQTWYLREAKKDGDVLANVVIDELATLGDDA